MKAVSPLGYFENTKKQLSASLEQRLVVGELPSEVCSYDVTPFYIYCPSMVEKLKRRYAPNLTIIGLVLLT